jgi:hypothetical protein
MPRTLRMPTTQQLPDGPHRRFVEELFMHYREAGRPTLREITGWIKKHQDDLRGTASTETVRRILSGAVLPRNWLTVETILQALCGLADRSTEEDRWPDDNWSSTQTFKGELQKRWNAALDYSDEDLPQLPPRPAPPEPARPQPADDPWATGPRGSFGSAEEPPF